MSLRRVDIGDLEPLRADPEAGLPHLAFIEIDRLRIDDRFQRPLGEKNWRVIRKIAAEFSWSKFQPISGAWLGSVETGPVSILDGQDRAHAARLAGFSVVPAMVVHLNQADHARAFVSINTARTALSAFHVLRAALAAGEDWAVRADQVVRDAGCRLMQTPYSQKDKQPGQIFAVSLIRSHVEAGRSLILLKALSALPGAAGGDVRVYGHGILAAWFAAVQACGSPDDADLAKFTAGCNLVDLYDRSAALRQQPAYAGRTVASLASAAFTARLRKFLAGSA